MLWLPQKDLTVYLASLYNQQTTASIVYDLDHIRLSEARQLVLDGGLKAGV
jgi:hypothetical protein